MNPSTIIDELANNMLVFETLFTNIPDEQVKWKPQPDKWSLLEIICHLHDEECEDFRMRVKQTLKDPSTPPPSIDPVAWVSERNYYEQDFETVKTKFLQERSASLQWLRSLQNPNWENTWQHPSLGPLSAGLFLHNWLAHDYLHIRQINRTKYLYLKSNTQISLGYAGEF